MTPGPGAALAEGRDSHRRQASQATRSNSRQVTIKVYRPGPKFTIVARGWAERKGGAGEIFETTRKIFTACGAIENFNDHRPRGRCLDIWKHPGLHAYFGLKECIPPYYKFLESTSTISPPTFPSRLSSLPCPISLPSVPPSHILPPRASALPHPCPTTNRCTSGVNWDQASATPVRVFGVS